MTGAAFFDLDRTLVRVNSAGLWARRELRRGKARRRDVLRVSWWVLRYTLGVLDVEDLARQATRPLKGMREDDFARRVDAWVRAEVLPYLTERAREEVARRKDRGEPCVILTSSSRYAAGPVAEALHIDHILASALKVEDGLFTGEPEYPVCYGQGKVTVAEAWAGAHGVDLGQSAFYTDSISDMPMLERVGEPVAINPDPRLRWTAWRRGWRSERW
ncbi:MAG: HAD family hydrolase [Deltaproteobacteria bacterium]|nr:HAD family hydrolase [Deltaproteobacteria bacterium]